MIPSLLAFAAALVATLALTPVARTAALRLGVVDCPDGRRKLQKQPVPLLGGAAVLSGWWIGLAITWLAGFPLPWSAAMPYAWLALTALLLVGICDDGFALRARWKLLAQIVAVLPLALSGSGLSQVTCAGWTFDLGALGPVTTGLWLIVGINSLNLIDGMDGMASLTGLCICLAIAAIDLCGGGGHVDVFALGLAGALASFLVFNFPPAKIYLGDAGSMVIGLAVALGSMRVCRTRDGVTQLTPMLALVALPLTDTGLAILRRWLSGRGIWYPDRGHLHHRLLDRGLSARGALAVVGGFSLLWGALVVAAHGRALEPLVWLAALVAGLLAVRWKLAGHHEWSLLTGSVAESLRGQVEVPSVAELEALPFAQAWDRLRSAVEAYPLERLTVAIEQIDGSVHRHHWRKETYTADNCESVVIELVRHTSQALTCSLQAETPSGQALRQTSQLVEVLERFAQFWAVHPETVPQAIAAAPLDDEPKVLQLPEPASRSSRRAA